MRGAAFSILALAIAACGTSARQIASSPPEDLAPSANVDCYAPDGDPPPAGTPAQVTVNGAAKIFLHGCESKDLTIELWTVKRTGGAEDGMPDALVGVAVTTPSDCEATGVPVAKDESCGTQTGQPFHCKYTYPSVPTETELLVKTSGAIWAPVYEYGFYIPNAEVTGGTFTKDVHALAADDYSVVAQVAVGTEITAGHGVVLGAVHDCSDVPVANAVVDIDVAHKLTTYFTDDEDDPLPDLSADGTSTLGLYGVIDVAPGPVALGASATLGGSIVTLGFMRARVFPDSVTLVDLRGTPPYQLPP